MDDDFDFTKPAGAKPAAAGTAAAPSAPAAPAKSRFYDAAIARRLFEAFGTPETVAAGGNFFVENEKAVKGGLFSKAVVNRMFFITSGEVTLSAGGKPLDAIRSGEVFGEMAVISGGARSATATARSDCTALALDAAQLQAAIQEMPEFALMLMSVMFDRLRLVAARLAARKIAPGTATAREAAVFPPELLQQLENALQHSTKVRYEAGRVIMREGEAGVCMYVVLTGRVAIAIRDKIVEMIGPGGTFGEMALVDRSGRSATAAAETDSTWLLIGRNDFVEMVTSRPAFGVALMRSMSARVLHIAKLLGS